MHYTLSLLLALVTYNSFSMNKSVELKRHHANESFKKAQKKLQDALTFNDYNEAKKALAEGARVDVTFENHHEPLTYVIARGNFALFELIIDAGAPINGIGKPYWSPLMTAAYWGKRDHVYVLLQLGAHVNYKSPAGSTALMSAAMRGETSCIEELIAHGADIEARDNEGYTALLNAGKSFYREDLLRDRRPSAEGAFALMLAGAQGTDAEIHTAQRAYNNYYRTWVPFWEGINQKRAALRAALLAVFKDSEKSEPHLRIIAEYLFGEFPSAKIKAGEIELKAAADGAESGDEA